MHDGVARDLADTSNVLSMRERVAGILSVAVESDNPVVASSLDALLVTTQLAHGRYVADQLELKALHKLLLESDRNITAGLAHEAVDRAFAGGRIGDLFAVANMLDVVGVGLALV